MTYLHPDPTHSVFPPKSMLGRLLAAICLTVLLSSCGSNEEETNAGDGNAASNNGRPAIAVTWIAASAQEIREVRNAVGSVEALGSPTIAAEVSGTIEAINVAEGEQAEADAPLAKIDAADYRDKRASAAAEVSRLTAQVEVQQRNLRRTRELSADEHVSEDEVDNAEAELDSRKQQLAAARANLRQAERNLGRTQIRAPTAGVISERLISVGDYVTAGEPLFNLVNRQRLRIRIPVSERLVERIDATTTLKLSNQSASQPPVTTTVTATKPVISPRTRSMHLLAFIDNPGNWQPGASVDAQVVLDTREDIVLPTQSVVRRPAGNVVYILTADGQGVTQRQVETGTRMGDEIEITSGIELGDKVIVDGAGFLSDSAKVRATPHASSESATE